MRHRLPPIARIRLARSLPRLLAWPMIVIATGVMASASWLLGSFGAGFGGVVFAVLGALLALVGLVVAILLLSVRLEVQESTVRLSWLGGERVYGLVRGPVTRVRLAGDEASKLKPRFGMFGWAIGSARLRDEEEIQVVRLARTPTAILLPTDRGRLAVAAADENVLLDALSRAARARQRLEELADAAPPPEPEPEPVRLTVAVEGERAEIEPHVLTGIERALLEQRLAEERAAAEAAAEAAADAQLRAAEEGAAVDVAAADATATSGTAAPGGGLARWRPRRSAAFALLPLAGAGIAWGVGLATGTYPDAGAEQSRLTALALVLAGPASSVGAIMALAWWPRLVGVIVAGGLAASVFIGRALLA